MIFNSFPREVGLKRRVVFNINEFIRYINMYNGKQNLYTSVYSFTDLKNNNNRITPVYNSAIVDKLYFDFDTDNAYEEMSKLHNYCDTNKLQHSMIFSGRGYHFYIFVEEDIFNFKKEAIMGAQLYFVKKFDLNLDEPIIGDIARITRIPNSYNLRAKRFCIPLSRSQFENNNDEEIKKMASKQNYNTHIILNFEKMNIKKYDVKTDDIIEIPNEIEINNSENIGELKNLPNCIVRLLNKNNCNWKERYIIILYFRENGYIINEVYQILKKYLTADKFKHCIKEEKQLQYLYKRHDIIFPSCERMMNEGFCLEYCKRRNKIIYK